MQNLTVYHILCSGHLLTYFLFTVPCIYCLSVDLNINGMKAWSVAVRVKLPLWRWHQNTPPVFSGQLMQGRGIFYNFCHLHGSKVGYHYDFDFFFSQLKVKVNNILVYLVPTFHQNPFEGFLSMHFKARYLFCSQTLGILEEFSQGGFRNLPFNHTLTK